VADALSLLVVAVTVIAVVYGTIKWLQKDRGDHTPHGHEHQG
jgi:hypothetical protein